MLCHLAEHWVYIAILPRPIATLTALSTMIAHLVRKNKKMINSHDFLAFTEPGACIVMAEKDKFPYFLVYSAANFELRIPQKGLAEPGPQSYNATNGNTKRFPSRAGAKPPI